MKKRLIALLLIAVMTVVCLPVLTSADGETVVTVYHTNDMHSYIRDKEEDDSSSNGKLSLAQVATLKKNTANALLVDDGDFDLGGSNYGNLTDGASIIEAMSAAGYDLAVLGNHEFDISVASFEEEIQAATFPVISSNISITEEYEEISSYLATMESTIILEAGGKKIGFFSIDTPTLRGMVSPSTLDAGGVVCDTDVPAVAAACVAELQTKGADVIIAMTHMGYTDSENTSGDETKYTSYDVALVDGVDAVIDGHDHVYRLADEAEKVGDDETLVVSTGTALDFLGALEITFNADGTLKSIVSKDVTDACAAAEKDTATQAVIQKWIDEVEKTTSEVAFQSEANFWGGNIAAWNANDEKQTTAVARRGYTNAGQLIADSMQYYAEAWVAENGDDFTSYGITSETPVVTYFGGGSVRGSFSEGDVTLGDLMTAYSFSFETDGGPNYIVVSPKTLWVLIEHGVNIFQSQDETTGQLTANGSIHGRFPQFAGLSYTYDINETASTEAIVNEDETVSMPETIGTRVQSITLDDGTVLDKNDNTSRIVLVTSDYQMGGGDGYWMLGYASDWDGYYTDTIYQQAMGEGWYLIEYIEDFYEGVIPADLYSLTSDRITRVNEVYQSDFFDSVITILDNDDNGIADYEVKVAVDGEEAKTYTTDANGQIEIKCLDNGAHEVEVITRKSSKTWYLDNYCGLVNIHINENPELVSGDEQKIDLANVTDLEVVSDAPLAEFIKVTIDGKELDKNNYTVVSGSTKVTVSKDYLKTLEAGEHTLGIVSKTGTVEAVFEVIAVPNTGDSTMIWAVCFAVAAAGVVVLKKREDD